MLRVALEDRWGTGERGRQWGMEMGRRTGDGVNIEERWRGLEWM